MLIKSQSEVCLHTGCSVHFHPSRFTRPFFRFFEGLVLRLGREGVREGDGGREGRERGREGEREGGRGRRGKRVRKDGGGKEEGRNSGKGSLGPRPLPF